MIHAPDKQKAVEGGSGTVYGGLATSVMIIT